MPSLPEPFLNDMKALDNDRSVLGMIFNIQHFCVDDGPGIRTTVFFKGCPLRCSWCHNPESHEARSEVMLRTDRCVMCRACAVACNTDAHTFDGGHIIDRSKCVGCGECVGACPTGAVELTGRRYTVDEVMAEILTDRVFYETSDGGVTLSGGEPTAQPEFAASLLAACKEKGLTTCIESCGWCDKETLSALIPLTDLFLIDWKLTDDVLHREYTGVSNQKIIENLAILNENGARVVLRCPLIPSVNLTEEHYDGIVSVANRFECIEGIDLEPYHPMGVDKSEALGKKTAYDNRSFLDRGTVEEVRDYIAPRVTVSVNCK